MNFVINITIISLLITAIILGLIINYRLSLFKKNKQDIFKTIQDLRNSTQNMERMLNAARKNAQNISSQLQEEMNKAILLRDDLLLMTERQISLSDIPTPRPEQASISFSPTAPAPTTITSESEKELIEALQRLKEIDS